MKSAFLLVSAFFLASAASCSPKIAPEIPEAMRLLAAGDQQQAEATVVAGLRRDARDPDLLFLAAVLDRSRFDISGSARIFARTMKLSPDSPEGLASACILGVDLSRDQRSALHYFNALLIVSQQNPDSIPIHWMAAVMTRQLTKNDRFHKDRFSLSSDLHNRLLECGIREYEKVLALMAPQPGPVLVHQTMGNLLGDVQGYDAALVHREVALKMERRPWSLQSAANTLNHLDRSAEAVALMNECIAMRPNDANDFYTLGTALSNLGRAREALNAWDKAANLEPKNQGYLKVCTIGFRDLGDYAAARKYTLRALANKPDDKLFQIYDARLAALLGEPDAADLLSKAGSFDFKKYVIAWKKPSEPWSLALEAGDIAAFRQMRESHDINAPDSKFSQTPLMIAAQNGWDHIAEELLQAGAKLDLVDANGDTALHYSAQFTQPRVMKLLLDAGAKTDLQDKWGQTPLIMAAGDEYDSAGFRMLMEKNADVNLATPHGGTALHYAAGHGHLARVKALLTRGANVNQTVKQSGETPLITACKDWAHSYIVAPLLAAGADVNARDKNGRTALHFAVDPLLNIPLVDLLLEKGANPALADAGGLTPISKARRLGFEELAAEMEKMTGTPEPFHLPLPPTDLSISDDRRATSFFVLPIELSDGRSPERQPGNQANEAKSARETLWQLHGINNTQELREEIQILQEFQPRLREAADLPEINDALEGRIKRAASKIYSTCKQETQDHAAWTQAHVIYLAELGVMAGLLDAEEGERITKNAAKIIRGRFSSWPEFTRSFVFGAKLEKAWEAERFENICNRIIEAGIPWL